MSENQNIKKSLKATSLFGGVQIFGILVTIIRTKLVALLIGPVGVGIVELYNSTIKLITSLTDFSLSVSAVRDVSIAYKSGNKARYSHVISVFSRIVWLTGLLGTFICLLGSPLWSKLTFGNYDYTIGFVLLSITLLLNQLKAGKSVLLQATEHFRYLALAGIVGNVIGLLTVVPIYYFWRLDGIVAVLLLVAIFPYVIIYFYAAKLNVKCEKVSFNSVINEGKGMLKQGFFLSVNFLLSTLVFYILRIVLNNTGGLAEIGLYSSSFVIVNTYVGMVFQSMSQEYYPRLSALSDKKKEFNEAVNSQTLFSLLLLGPMIFCFLAFSEQILTILYSNKFIGASLLMALSMLGVVFQAPSWCMGYAFLAKGDNMAFFFYETTAKAIKLVLDILFYLLLGLTGLGISFIISYIYYFLQCALVCKLRYDINLSREVYTLLCLYFIIGGGLVFAVFNLTLLYAVVIGLIAIILSSFFSYYKLNKIVNISGFIKRKLYHNNEK